MKKRSSLSGISCATPQPGTAFLEVGRNERLVGATSIPMMASQQQVLNVASDVNVNDCYNACSRVMRTAPFQFEVDPSTGACLW